MLKWLMEKLKNKYLPILTSIVVVLGVSGCASKENYPIGKDTYEAFGDGRFQILRMGTRRTLYDMKARDTLLLKIESWRTEGNWIYAKGDNERFVLLNYRTGFINNYKSLDDVPAEFREHFLK